MKISTGWTDLEYLLIPVLSQKINWFPRMANRFSFHKGNVEAGGVIVDELKEEHLQSQAVLIVSHRTGKLCCPSRDGKFLGLNCARLCKRGRKKTKKKRNTNSPKSVIQMATRSYSILRIMITTKLMMEAVTDVAIWGVTYSFIGSKFFSSLESLSLIDKAKKTARRYTMMATMDARIKKI